MLQYQRWFFGNCISWPAYTRGLTVTLKKKSSPCFLICSFFMIFRISTGEIGLAGKDIGNGMDK